LDLPAAALRTQVVGAPEDVCGKLTYYCRPLIGGYEISWFNDAERSSHGCTLMPPATRSNGDTVFVTAAHCSEYEWHDDGEVFYQPHITPGSKIGVELLDPPGWTCSDALLYKCRYSDALLFSVSDDSLKLGQIARNGSTQQGDLTVSQTEPPYSVAGETSVAVGDKIYKIGKTTGWTGGFIDQTCVTVNKNDRFHKFLCQHVSDINSTAGDSGAPIYMWTSGDNVLLVGLLWGRYEPYDHSYLSPMRMIEEDLGALDFRSEEHRAGGSDGDPVGGCPGCPIET